MKYRKQHTPPSGQSDDSDPIHYYRRGLFGDTLFADEFAEIYEGPYLDDAECSYEEEATYAPEIDEAIARCAAIGYSRLKLPKPDSLIKHWGQGFLRQNIDRFVRAYWDEQGVLPKGPHLVGAHQIDFGQGK